MTYRQRKLLSAFGVLSYVLGIALGVGVLFSDNNVNISSQPWSPDGKQIVFVWNNHLYTLDVNNYAVHQLTDLPGQYGEPAWSPLGNQIVYMFRPEQSSQYELWLIDADGQNAKRAFPDVGLGEHFPHWSPDGKWLGYYRTRVYNGSPYEYGFSRFVVTDFNKTIQQPADVEIADDMAWSPDSREFTFSGFKDKTWHIYSVITTDGALKELTNSDYDKSPAWSPDGKQLAFYSERSQNLRGSVYSLEVSTQTIRQITEDSNRTDRLLWSPDGQKIALSAYGDSPDYSDLYVYVMNADGTNRQLLSSNITGQFGWSPSGQFLVSTASNYLIIQDTYTNTTISRYATQLGPSLLFLPVPATQIMTIVLVLLGPLLSIPAKIGDIARIYHPLVRDLRAAFQCYVMFVIYTFAFFVVMAFITIVGIIIRLVWN